MDKRIDVIAGRHARGLATDEMAQPELAYAPSFGSAKDPVNMLGYVADNVRSGTVRTVQWPELDAAVAAGALLVDVRTPPEHAAGRIRGSVNIAIDDLREPVSDLPAGPLIACCAVGQRAPTALVAIGALPPRDERLIRLERWAARVIAGRPGRDQQMLQRYVIWHVLRRLRGRLRGTLVTTGQDETARRSIRAAVTLLDWLTARDLTLASARQGDWTHGWPARRPPTASPRGTSSAGPGSRS